MNLQELKTRSPAELLAFAEELDIENCSAMRKQDMMFAILKQLAMQGVPISGVGVLEVLQDGFGFLRSPEKITCRDRMTFMFRPVRCAVSVCGLAISSKVKSAPRKILSDILRF